MRLVEFSRPVSEAFLIPPGSPLPPNVVDYRDPAKTKGRRIKGGHYIRKAQTKIFLTPDNGAVLYFYGDNNVMPWKDLYPTISDPNDANTVAVHGTGFLINRSRTVGSWDGDRNRYSNDIRSIVKRLLDLKIASPNSPIWIGNWAARQGEHIGTIRDILAMSEPTRLVLYHGTDTVRLAQIMQTGLKALPFDDRVWNNTSLDKKRPEHRETSIYLTASLPQAEYYANKATNVDRKRMGPEKRRDAFNTLQGAKQGVADLQRKLERLKALSPEQAAAEDAHQARYSYGRALTVADQIAIIPDQITRYEEMIAKAEPLAALYTSFEGKIEPVVLQVTLTAKEFGKLMADDDHLSQNPTTAPDDWKTSLEHFGQVAFRGTIPPNRIKIVSTGNKTRSR